MADKIVFDGELKYICPHCGTKQETILTSWKAWGLSEVSFSLARGRIESEEEPSISDYVDIEEEEAYFCPYCERMLTAEDVMNGFRKWLERLKQEDPEEYAEIIAELL